MDELQRQAFGQAIGQLYHALPHGQEPGSHLGRIAALIGNRITDCADPEFISGLAFLEQGQDSKASIGSSRVVVEPGEGGGQGAGQFIWSRAGERAIKAVRIRKLGHQRGYRSS